MKQRRVGDIVILYPQGRLAGGPETDELERTIKELGEGGNQRLLINLSETQHLDSKALGVLIWGRSDYLRRGGQMKVCAVDRIRNTFLMTRLSLVFEVFSTEEEALGGEPGALPSDT